MCSRFKICELGGDLRAGAGPHDRLDGNGNGGGAHGNAVRDNIYGDQDLGCCTQTDQRGDIRCIRSAGESLEGNKYFSTLSAARSRLMDLESLAPAGDRPPERIPASPAPR